MIRKTSEIVKEQLDSYNLTELVLGSDKNFVERFDVKTVGSLEFELDQIKQIVSSVMSKLRAEQRQEFLDRFIMFLTSVEILMEENVAKKIEDLGDMVDKENVLMFPINKSIH